MNLQHGKNRIIQILAVGAVVLLSAVLLWVFLQYCFPGLMPLVRKGDEQAIAAYIHEEGAWIGALLIVLLCILQVMSIVLPGARSMWRRASSTAGGGACSCAIQGSYWATRWSFSLPGG